MNKRLACLAALIPDGRGLIDVGTDHGYLPLALAQRGYPGRLFASDIAPGPLRAAEKTFREAGLSGRIELLLADGLDGCDPGAVDGIAIAGMGGDTVCGILDRAEWCLDARYTLYLQPMTRAEVLRYWLVHNGFAIVEETLVEDGGLLYAALAARFGGETRLNDAELFTGSRALLGGHPLFEKQLRQQRARHEKALRGLESSRKQENRARAALLRDILEQMEERHEDD